MKCIEKIGYLADTQLGRKIGGFDPTDWIMEAMWRFARRCVEESVGAIVHLGDVFDTNIPSPYLFGRLLEWMRYVTDKGIELYLLVGNHDAIHTSLTSLSCLDFLDIVQLAKIHVVNRFGLISPRLFKQLYFAIPYPSRRSYNRDWENELIFRFLRAEKLALREGRELVVWSHVDIEGASLGNNTRMKGTPRTLPARILRSEAVRTVYAGHIHKAQLIQSCEATIRVVGSVTRLRFDEMAEGKKGLIVQGEKEKEVDLFPPPFRLLTPDCRGKTTDWYRKYEYGDVLMDKLMDERVFNGAVVKVVPLVREDDKIDWEPFRQRILSCGPIYLYPIVPKVETSRTVRDEKQKFTLVWSAALRRTLQSMGVKRKERKRLIKMAAQVRNEGAR